MGINQSVVSWSKSYTLGLPDIDGQHKGLFDLINQIWVAIINNSPREATLALIQRLEHYTIAHFTEEEAFMRVMNYQDYDQHKRMHDAFIDRISRERASIENHSGGLTLDLLRFLKTWLVDHILLVDKQYADFFVASQQKPGLLKRIFSW